MSPQQIDAQSALTEQVDRFRAWAAAHPVEGRSGEWECDYADWPSLYAAVLGFVAQQPMASWSDGERAAVLYAIARDNEMEHLVGEISERHPALLANLAEAAIQSGEADTKWQFAAALGRSSHDAVRREQLLLQLAKDSHEYVRRRSLGSLAHLRSAATEALALKAWSRPDESQQWSRMMALSALWSIDSEHLPRLLAAAQEDGRPYLAATAAKIRDGTAERL